MQTNNFHLVWVGTVIILLQGSSEAIARSKPIAEKSPIQSSTTIEQQKPLDLSVPFKMTTDEAVRKHSELEQSNAAGKESNFFPPKRKAENLPVQLKGRVFLTPDQETEKNKSFDGAGIMINLKQ